MASVMSVEAVYGRTRWCVLCLLRQFMDVRDGECYVCRSSNINKDYYYFKLQVMRVTC